MIVTAKTGAHAQRHVDHAAIDVDVVVGGLWGSGKGAALLAEGAAGVRRRPRPRYRTARELPARWRSRWHRGRARWLSSPQAGADVVLELVGRVPGLVGSVRPRTTARTISQARLRSHGSAHGRLQRRRGLGLPAGGCRPGAGRRTRWSAATAISASLPAAELDGGACSSRPVSGCSC